MTKRYPLHDSPFYKLKGVGQLERTLQAKLDDVERLSSRESYRVWVEDGREIQAPKGALAAIHRRMANLLKRIAVPDYVYSTKGRSHIDNAAQHCGPVPLVKTDISKFYPSTSREMVLRLFRDDFKCAGDLAHMLADLCCFDRQHLPTGSRISGYIAFLAAKPMLDRVHSIVAAKQCVMTAFVDDIAVSGEKAGMPLLLEIRKELRRNGFKTSNRKSRAYRTEEPKKLTGAIVTTAGLLLPNKQHHKIRSTRLALAGALEPRARKHLRLRLRGQLEAAAQLARHPAAYRATPAQVELLRATG